MANCHCPSDFEEMNWPSSTSVSTMCDFDVSLFFFFLFFLIRSVIFLHLNTMDDVGFDMYQTQ